MIFFLTIFHFLSVWLISPIADLPLQFLIRLALISRVDYHLGACVIKMFCFSIETRYMLHFNERQIVHWLLSARCRISSLIYCKCKVQTLFTVLIRCRFRFRHQYFPFHFDYFTNELGNVQYLNFNVRGLIE